ncbi:MAG: helix-turn-helix transcriptional regulator [Clostridia bacterium]|nr:helix-turn-helix transcriptional regulator [Clostridia bacterium]
MSVYTGYKLTDDIVIDKLYTVYYFEFSKAYTFSGESHNFWELVYVDKGRITAVADGKHHVLDQGDIIFHKPNEWHELKANGTVAPNIVVITFSSESDAINFFENKILRINQHQKRIISKIISEYSSAFSTPLNVPKTGSLSAKEGGSFGSQQLLKQFICELLISLIRSSNPSDGQVSLMRLSTSHSLLNLLLNYMEINSNKNIQINDLIKYSGSNKTTITNTFQEAFGMSPIEYFIHTKIERAKTFLREEAYSITQVAEILGYSSIHYFSRQFKRVTGISPTQYLNSVKAMTLPENY